MDPQDEGWPLGLRLLNGRVGLVGRSRDFSGSISFSTLVTGSPASSTDSFSDLDTESTGSFFNDNSITLGSLLGASSILHLSRRSSTGRRAAEALRNQKSTSYKPIIRPTWLFSLCPRLTTDAVTTATNNNNNNTAAPSLGHFLQAERRAAASIHRRNMMSPITTTLYGPTNGFSSTQQVVLANPSLNPLFLNGARVGADGGGGRSNNIANTLRPGGACGSSPILFSRLCGQPVGS